MHNGAFGPLYVLDDESPIWHQVSATEKFNSSLAYFIKATPNDLTDPKKKDYIIKDAVIFDDNNQIIDTINLICDKDFNNDTYTNEFKDGVTYYKPYCLYKKASVYSPKIQYYRNLNSLWGLLKEFQNSRNNYQSNWEEDKPGVPGYILNRPNIIFSTEAAATKYLLDYNNAEENDFEINPLTEIEVANLENLQTIFNSLNENEYLIMYYLDNI